MNKKRIVSMALCVFIFASTAVGPLKGMSGEQAQKPFKVGSLFGGLGLLGASCAGIALYSVGTFMTLVFAGEAFEELVEEICCKEDLSEDVLEKIKQFSIILGSLATISALSFISASEGVRFIGTAGGVQYADRTYGQIAREFTRTGSKGFCFSLILPIAIALSGQIRKIMKKNVKDKSTLKKTLAACLSVARRNSLGVAVLAASVYGGFCK